MVESYKADSRIALRYLYTQYLSRPEGVWLREAFSFASFLLGASPAGNRMEGKQFRDRELDIQIYIVKCRTCFKRCSRLFVPEACTERMELAADPTSPILPQRCPSTARPSTTTVESDPAASVLQATPRPVRKYTAAAVVACPLQQRIDHLMRHGECAEGYPWATPRQLEGRSVFEAFVACMQSGRGQELSTAAVAAALLMARHGLSRKLACDHCKIPEGGTRSRVGTLAKQLSYVCRIMPEESAWPELPSEWVPPPPVPAAKKTVVQRYAAGWQAYMQLPEVPPPSTSTSTLHLYPPTCSLHLHPPGEADASWVRRTANRAQRRCVVARRHAPCARASAVHASWRRRDRHVPEQHDAR